MDLTPADLLECQNCSFESGLIGWTTWDTQDPYYPLAVGGIGVNPEGRFFPSQPSDGALALLTGFDGSIPGLISAGRIVLLPAAGSAIMTFDYRAGWDLMGYGASLDRAFMVAISDPPSQEVIGLETILIVAAGSRLPDTGLRQGVIDLTRFAGKSILIEFLWDVPEGMTGPAFFQLDNIEIRIQNV
ncbi:MAG: hypothetical protein MJE77_32470 [Proteobacteria bacterium]|nr:hypothetical protein [Pseudomonadota bacterium]